MSNQLVGDVYGKIIEEVVNASSTDFEESGVSQSTLKELQREWQSKLSARNVAFMPWDTKPEPVAPPPVSAAPPAAQMPPTSYANYNQQQPNNGANGARIKAETQQENHYGSLPNQNYPQNIAPQGGTARAQYLLQQQYGNGASASISAIGQQGQQRGGLALPGQQQQAKPHGLQLPPQGQMGGHPQYSQQQQQQAYHQQQQQRMQQQQQQQHRHQQQRAQPPIKTENDSPQIQQGGFQQQQVNYSQTDGAGDDSALAQWQAMIAERRAAHAAHGEQADRLIRDQVSQISAELENGLMVPLDDKKSSKQRRRQKPAAMTVIPEASSSSSVPKISQLDGAEDEDAKGGIKDEEDEDAINSDLDDSDEEGQGNMDDEDDEEGDSILCTYDKVQRVKNKWKCTLKDGVMSVNGKEWVFHKGTGEYEW